MAAIVNYRDLLLQGAATRYIAPSTAFDPSTLGDLAYLDQVGTPQIQPGSITADSSIVAPGAILTQAIGANAVTVSDFASGSVSDLTLNYNLVGDSGRLYDVFILATLVQSFPSTISLSVDGVTQWAEIPVDGTLATKGHVIALYSGSHTIRLWSSNASNTNGTSIYALATKR